MDNKANNNENVNYQKIFKNWKTEQNAYKTLIKNYIINCNGETQPTSKKLIPVKIGIRNIIKAYMKGLLTVNEVSIFFHTLYIELVQALSIELYNIKTSGYAFMNPTNSKDPLFLPLLIVDWIWLIDQEIEGMNSNLNDQVENAKYKQEQKSKIALLAKELLVK